MKASELLLQIGRLDKRTQNKFACGNQKKKIMAKYYETETRKKDIINKSTFRNW